MISEDFNNIKFRNKCHHCTLVKAWFSREQLQRARNRLLLLLLQVLFLTLFPWGNNLFKIGGQYQRKVVRENARASPRLSRPLSRAARAWLLTISPSWGACSQSNLSAFLWSVFTVGVSTIKALTICMENPAIQKRIQMERFIPFEMFSGKKVIPTEVLN